MYRPKLQQTAMARLNIQQTPPSVSHTTLVWFVHQDPIKRHADVYSCFTCLTSMKVKSGY